MSTATNSIGTPPTLVIASVAGFSVTVTARRTTWAWWRCGPPESRTVQMFEHSPAMIKSPLSAGSI